MKGIINMKYKINFNIYGIVNLIIIFISIICFYFINSSFKSNDVDFLLKITGWFANFAFLWCIFSTYKIKKNIFDYNIIFLVFVFLFCNGQVFLYTLGVNESKLSVFVLESKTKIVSAVTYFYYSLLLFHQGSLLILKNPIEKVKTISDDKCVLAIRRISILVFIVSIIPYISTIAPKLINSIKYGYKYLYENPNESSGIVLYFSKMFIPSLLLLLYSYKESKPISFSIIIFLIMISIANLIIGARGSSLSIVVIIVVFINTFVQPIKGIAFLKIVALILLIMLIIPIVYKYRGIENKSFDNFMKTVDEVVHDPDENFVSKTISELGYNMHSFILTKGVVPSQYDYKYGESYGASVLMIIPSFMLGGFSFAEKAALDTWLQDTYNMSYGPGFSMFAETYYNFGWLGGILFAFVLGFFFTKMFNISSSNVNKNSIFNILSFIFLYNELLAARYPFHSTIRNVVYMYILLYFLIVTVYSRISKERYNE